MVKRENRKLGLNARLAVLRPLLVGALVLCGTFAPRARGGDQKTARHHVLVISVDGLGASWFTEPRAGLHIPNLARVKEQGSYAEGVDGVYPTVTYPSHTTIVTGRLPAEHGIFSNLSSRQAGKNPRDWFWFASAIKVPTLWDEARHAGLSTAAVSWPVTVGAQIDWNVPEIWDPQKGEIGDPLYLAKFMNPALTVELAAALGPAPAGADDDVNRTRLAVYILTRHKPDLMLVHLARLDEAEHQHGPQSSEAAATLERIDARIGELLDAVKDAGVEDATDVFIVSDHGFLPIEREIRPNVLLIKAGLLTADARGNITGGRIATVANGGSFFIYWPEGADLRSEIDRALAPLRDEGMVWSEFSHAALVEMGADPAAQLALEAPSGSSYDNAAGGEVTIKLKAPGGTHGYLSFRRGLEASFIAFGPRIKAGVNLHRIRMTAVGPTLVKDLGINDPGFGIETPLKDIFK